MVAIDRKYVIKHIIKRDLNGIYEDYKSAIKEYESRWNNVEWHLYYSMYISLAQDKIKTLIIKLSKFY